jgi:hypothetical protein
MQGRAVPCAAVGTLTADLRSTPRPGCLTPSRC